ncbi:hypothetical protein LOK49_LG02G01035 [Camellia lanceoleosa]|uniref:Uncharacterized protein n=1 Tax=Camellia lanceoleosa TaxID=1840588 RepID=A0ACC0IM42_9ERIC|nr:hypothetical protein LOK49_LG02G01035 [Camellia lanceoleosa]
MPHRHLVQSADDDLVPPLHSLLLQMTHRNLTHHQNKLDDVRVLKLGKIERKRLRLRLRLRGRLFERERDGDCKIPDVVSTLAKVAAVIAEARR